MRILFAIFAISTVSIGMAGEDYLSYGIPADAQKIGPRSVFGDPAKQSFVYVPSGAKASRENIIAREVYEDGVLVRQELLKNERKHGVLREWFPNGIQKLESPYENGQMNGTFKVWSDRGDLIGQYVMQNGTGVVMIYDASKKLVQEEHCENGKRNGLRMEHMGDVISICWYKQGERAGIGFSISDSGEYINMTYISSSNRLFSGLYVRFPKSGAPGRIVWYANGHEVTEAEYKAAGAGDPEMLPFNSDIEEYRKLVNKKGKAFFEKFQKMPKVKIPLQFGSDGRLILAP